MERDYLDWKMHEEYSNVDTERFCVYDREVV